jgi:hypothetical protein
MNQIHRATHALDHRAGDHPVRDVSSRADLHRAKNATSILPPRVMPKDNAESKNEDPRSAVTVSFPR